MYITKHVVNDGVVRLAVTGEIDLATAGQVREAIDNTLAAGTVAELLVDLDAVTFCDSSGIGALHAGRVTAIGAGTAYRVTNPRDTVLNTLILSGTLLTLTGGTA